MLLVVLGAGIPIVLHVTQRGHDVLPFSVAEEYPPGKKIVPGEVFATTLAELVEHELGGLSGWRPNDFVLWGPGLWADNNANRQLGIMSGGARDRRVSSRIT